MTTDTPTEHDAINAAYEALGRNADDAQNNAAVLEDRQLLDRLLALDLAYAHAEKPEPDVAALLIRHACGLQRKVVDEVAARGRTSWKNDDITRWRSGAIAAGNMAYSIECDRGVSTIKASASAPDPDQPTGMPAEDTPPGKPAMDPDKAADAPQAMAAV